MKRAELLGQRFGRLTVIACEGSKNNQIHWLCRCDCGGETIASTAHLRSGHTQSCGCLKREITGNLRRTHGRHKEPIYGVWAQMRQRCSSPTSKDYKYYGARGISVCPEWDSFEAFFEYVSKLPHFGEPGRSLDRTENNGNYEPGNVRWATMYEQAQNRRRRIKTA